MKRVDLGTALLFDIAFLYLGITTGESYYWYALILNIVIFIVTVLIRYHNYKEEYDYDSSTPKVLSFEETINYQFVKIIWCYYNLDIMPGSIPFNGSQLFCIWEFMREICEEKNYVVEWVNDMYLLSIIYDEAGHYAVTHPKSFHPSDKSVEAFLECKKSILKYLEENKKEKYRSEAQRCFRVFYNSLLYDPIKL